MNAVRAIQQLNKRELDAAIGTEGSWHTDYRDTAFVNIGGLPLELSEGDIITIFSQYGEPVWIKLARDKDTGKSRGYAWIKYEDQRSCDLAVDNLGGATVMDRVLRVDHARYKPKDDEDMRDNTMGHGELDPADDADAGRRKRPKTHRDSDSDGDSDEDRPLLPEEIELGRLMDKLDEDDPMRDAIIKRQQEKVDDALRKLDKARRKEKERLRRREKHHRRDGSRDRHREKDRRRIKDGAHDQDREPHSRPRDDQRSRDRDSHHERRHRTSRHRDDSADNVRDRHRHSHSDKKERSRRHSMSDSEDREHPPRSKRSPLPYRARSPRSHRDRVRE
ncbi:RNA-binding protein Cwf29 [Pleosporales sp. CAS-2024a]